VGCAGACGVPKVPKEDWYGACGVPKVPKEDWKDWGWLTQDGLCGVPKVPKEDWGWLTQDGLCGIWGCCEAPNVLEVGLEG
jgi:hypothetical protein